MRKEQDKILDCVEFQTQFNDDTMSCQCNVMLALESVASMCDGLFGIMAFHCQDITLQLFCYSLQGCTVKQNSLKIIRKRGVGQD